MSTTLPPPTINALRPSHRARLSATLESDLLSRNPTLHDAPSLKPRPLILCLNEVSAANMIEHAESAQVLAWPSPLSPTFSSEDEPVSPMTPAPLLHERVARLTRAMGLSQHQRSPSESSARSLWPNRGSKEIEADIISTTLPPPTVNSLDPSQRARLLKSTRKLENLLGATPQAAESLHLSQNGHTKRRSFQLPRPLILHSAVTRLNVSIEQPSSPDSAHVLTWPPPAILTPSPLSSVFSTEDEPMSPMEVPDEKIHRRRLSKLTRTLGENIPPELIVPKHSQHSRSPSEPPSCSLWPDWGTDGMAPGNVIQTFTAVSVDTVDALSITLPPPPINAPPSPLSSVFSTEDEPMSPMEVPDEKIHRRRMSKLTRTLGENIPTELIVPKHSHSQHSRSPSEPPPRSLWPDWGTDGMTPGKVMDTVDAPSTTINALGPSQRARLIKSTRKLENLLGETPQVVGSATTTAIPFPRSIESAKVPVLSEDGPPDKPKKHRKRRAAHLPRPLVLHHNNVSAVTRLIDPPSSAGSAQVLTLPRTTITVSSPLSSVFSPKDESMSPMEVPHEKIRRRRMAKLTRTLGENIPTELIMTPDHLRHQRSPSEPSPRSLWPNWGKKEDAYLTGNDPSVTNATVVPSSRSKPVVIRRPRRRPLSMGSEVIFASKHYTANSSSTESVDTSDYETAGDNGVDVFGEDWHGEWSIKDARERATALRNLRGH